MRLLITGGCGFVGHHVVEHVLRNTDWEIVVLDGLNYAASANRLEDLECWSQERHRVTLLWHDLRAPISDTLHDRIGQVDYVWHLAAESHVDRSLVDSVPFVTANVLGTANLLEYVRARQAGLRQYVQFSTDEVYGPAPEGTAWREWDRLKPSNPYAASKAGGDMLALAFAHSFGLPIIVTRTMNVYGERQHAEKFVPKTVRAILQGEPVTIHATAAGASRRCWVHARNAADALLFLAEHGEPEEIYNVVGQERSVWDLADLACREVRGRPLGAADCEYADAHTLRPGHDWRYALDGSRLAAMGWTPPVPFEESFRRTVRWMADPANGRWLGLAAPAARL
jgi:dTDP-glucose 4,6-dehydratase